MMMMMAEATKEETKKKSEKGIETFFMIPSDVVVVASFYVFLQSHI